MLIKKPIGFLFFMYLLLGQENQTPAFTYAGGWPVNPKSDTIEDPGFDLPCPGPTGCECLSNADCFNQNCRAHPKGNYCVPKVGDLIPRFEAIDQFGESVDLYDFAHQGKMTLIELSSAWCSPCKDLAAWLTTNDSKIMKNPWWKEQYQPIRELIESGKVQLINIMFEGNEKKITANFEDILLWYTNYPDQNVPILLDEYRIMHSWVKPTGLPCIFLLDENMRLINYTNRGLTDAFLYLTQSKK